MSGAGDFLSQARKLGALTLATSVLGFARELLIARKFGATHGTDSYLVALSIPSLLYIFLIGSGLTVSVIPRLASQLSHDPAAGAKNFAAFLSATAAFGAVMSGLIFAFSGVLVRVVAPGVAFSSLTIEFTRLLSPLFFLFVVTYSLASFQCAQNRTAFWGLVGLILNASVVLAIFLLPSERGVRVLVWGTIAGAWIALLVQAHVARRKGFRELWVNPLREREGLRIVAAMVPFALAFGIGGEFGTAQADSFLVRFFASKLGPGNITLLALGNKLMGLPVLLVGSALALAVLPSVSVAFSEGNYCEAAGKLVQSLSWALLLISPIFVLYLDGSHQIVNTVFERGGLTPIQIEVLGGILRCYSGAVIGLTLVYVLGRFLAALRDSRFLIIAGVATVGLDAVLMYLLSPRLGGAGIALSVSIGSFFYSATLAAELVRKLKTPVAREMIRRIGVILGGALAMHGIVRGMSRVGVHVFSPWLTIGMFPLFAGVTAYVAWVMVFRNQFRFVSAQDAVPR